MEMKWCPQCTQFRPTIDFYKHKNRPDGLASACKECQKQMRGRRTGIIVLCPVCGQNFFRKYTRQKICSLKCVGILSQSKRNQKGSNNSNWKGGITISKKGYVYIMNPSHHRANKKGYVKRADIVLEEKIGRSLNDNEIAHHINEIKNDDSPENLELHTIKSHAKLHGDKRRKIKHNILPVVEITDTSKKLKKVVNWPSKEELLEMTTLLSLREIAKKLNCSHVAVFRRLKKI